MQATAPTKAIVPADSLAQMTKTSAFTPRLCRARVQVRGTRWLNRDWFSDSDSDGVESQVVFV